MKRSSYKAGDVREDGYIFATYARRGDKIIEHWYSPDAQQRRMLHFTLSRARKRSKDSNAECDLDIDYLVALFPSDGRCPVFGVPLEWGKKNGLENSPSLDRIDPSKGYVRGNVTFMSQRANRLKQDATPEELLRLATYVQQLTAREIIL